MKGQLKCHRCAKCNGYGCPDMLPGLGGVMGGVIFTLADFSLAVLTNHIHSLSVAQQMSINYLNAPKGSRLISRAEKVKSGKTTTIVNIKVTDDTGREIAILTATAFKL